MTGDFLVAISVLTLDVDVIIDIFSNMLLKLLLLLFNVFLLSYLGISAIKETLIEKPSIISKFKENEYKNEDFRIKSSGITQYGT